VRVSENGAGGENSAEYQRFFKQCAYIGRTYHI